LLKQKLILLLIHYTILLTEIVGAVVHFIFIVFLRDYLGRL